MNWTVFTAIFTAIAAIATLIAAGIALWIACTEQWRQEKHRQKILNSQKCDLILVPMKEYNAGEQYQALSSELYGLKATNKFFQERVTLLSPSELYWLDSERIYGVDIKPDFLVNEAKIQYENTRYFKEIFVTARGKKHDKQKSKEKKEIKSSRKEGQTPVVESAYTSQKNKRVSIKWIEIGNGLGGWATAATVILSLYSFLILFGVEMKLRKYNLMIANAQILPSIFVFGILSMIVAILISIVFAILYCATKNIAWKIFVLFLSYVMILICAVSQQIGINNSYTALKSYEIIILLEQIAKLNPLVFICFGLGAIWCCVWYFIVENKMVPYCCRICTISIVLSLVMFLSVEINPNHFKTVHIPKDETKETITKNILCTDSGDQIWAIICETANYYYIEPIVGKHSTHYASEDEKYDIDKNCSMAIEKTNMIVYAETVREVVKAAHQYDIRTSQ